MCSFCCLENWCLQAKTSSRREEAPQQYQQQVQVYQMSRYSKWLTLRALWGGCCRHPHLYKRMLILRSVEEANSQNLNKGRQLWCLHIQQGGDSRSGPRTCSLLPAELLPQPLNTQLTWCGVSWSSAVILTLYFRTLQGGIQYHLRLG